MNDQQQAQADKDMMAEMTRRDERVAEIRTHLLATQPLVHPITAYVVAGDLESAERATAEVTRGADPITVVGHIGSYARWDWTVTMLNLGKITPSWFYENIADLWSGSDPDDTNPAYLNLWRLARHANGSYVRDGRALPKSSVKGFVTIYRGGYPATIGNGFAWTTDPKIAGKFATTLGQRQPVPGGIVISGEVSPSDVLAYITDRNEAEVIVDPRAVRNVRQVKR
jgi:hypothetical protein